MTSRINITAGEVSLQAILNESSTASRIVDALPLQGKVNRWGEEIYFSIPVQVEESEDARQEMEVGELAYWPSGTAFCIFFGPTPVSSGTNPRAYSNVNPFGRVDGDPSALKEVQDGEAIQVSLLEV